MCVCVLIHADGDRNESRCVRKRAEDDVVCWLFITYVCVGKSEWSEDVAKVLAKSVITNPN